jgi:hypothetical protein
MKKLLIAFTILAAISSCERSTKGHWTESDKSKALKDCKSGAKDLSELEKEMIDVDKFCNCAVEKLEKEYDNFSKADKMGDDQIQRFAEICIMDLFKGE